MTKEYLGQEYLAATNTKGLKQDSGLVRVATRLSVVGSVLALTLSVLMIIIGIIYFLSPVHGCSMMTTINATGKDTDSAVGTIAKTPNRGDIIIMKLYLDETGEHADMTSTYYQERWAYLDNERGHYMYIVKRLIAVAGDEIAILRTPNGGTHADSDFNYDYTLYLNGQILDEPYLAAAYAPTNAANYRKFYNIMYNPTDVNQQDWVQTNRDAMVHDGVVNGQTVPVLTVPDGYYFIMGDNRLDSWDSTALGPRHCGDFIGTCLEIVPNETNIMQYLWNKMVYYVFFGWAWQ